MKAEEMNQACFELSRALEGLDWCVPEAQPLARTALRVAGRLLIDAAAEGARAEHWPNTETTALQWLRAALNAIGYDVTPLPGSGREPVPDLSAEW
jgi:hypothetical protein